MFKLLLGGTLCLLLLLQNVTAKALVESFTDIDSYSYGHGLRVKRANADIFNNGHVMSEKTKNELFSPRNPNVPGAMQNYLNNIAKKDDKIRQPGRTNINPYNARSAHTFIVGSRKDVQQSIVNGNKVYPQLPIHENNLYDSRKSFQQIQVDRFQRGNPDAGKLKRIADTGVRPFQAGVDLNSNKPVHFQAPRNIPINRVIWQGKGPQAPPPAFSNVSNRLGTQARVNNNRGGFSAQTRGGNKFGGFFRGRG